MGNFDLIVHQNYTNLCQRVYSSDFKPCHMIGRIGREKSVNLNFLENPVFDHMGKFGTIVALNYATFYVMILTKGCLQNLQHDIEHNE